MFSLRFSGSKCLMNLRRQFRVRKIFLAQFFAGFAFFSFYFTFEITISIVRDLLSRVLSH